jgi:hypothetical protein
VRISQELIDASPQSSRSHLTGFPSPARQSSDSMTVLNVRSRMISVRLSEDEYSALVNLCASSGARSVSDLARNALRMLVNGGENSDISQLHADDFLTQIQMLNRKVEELNERVTRSHRQGLSPASGSGAR